MSNDGPQATIFGKLFMFIFLAACLGGAWWLLSKPKTVTQPEPSGNNAPAQTAQTAKTPSAHAVHIGIAYGTEKQRWLEWAVQQFSAQADNRDIVVDLLPLGSLEGAQAVLERDERIVVWSPASTLYTETFTNEWSIKHGGNPIVSQENLALSPMVFVWWKDRRDAFVAKYGTVTFATISEGLNERSGWAEIAQKPEWGLFKFGHTHPNQSNSGLVTLVSMAYEFHGSFSGLTLANILDPKFQAWFHRTEAAVSGLSHSTGTMMREMVLKGPSAFDCLFVYENVVIDYLENAKGRWGELAVDYPPANFWNDNPYYILDVPWSTPAQRSAAKRFGTFLMSEPIQAKALDHGLRPGNPAVGVLGDNSPFTRYKAQGLKNALSQVCSAPPAEVITNLLQSWQRSRGGR